MTYSIGEVAKIVRVCAQTLRKYGQLGLIPAGTRRPSSHRSYTDADIEAIKKYFEQKR